MADKAAPRPDDIRWDVYPDSDGSASLPVDFAEPETASVGRPVYSTPPLGGAEPTAVERPAAPSSVARPATSERVWVGRSGWWLQLLFAALGLGAAGGCLWLLVTSVIPRGDPPGMIALLIILPLVVLAICAWPVWYFGPMSLVLDDTGVRMKRYRKVRSLRYDQLVDVWESEGGKNYGPGVGIVPKGPDGNPQKNGAFWWTIPGFSFTDKQLRDFADTLEERMKELR